MIQYNVQFIVFSLFPLLYSLKNNNIALLLIILILKENIIGFTYETRIKDSGWSGRNDKSRC